MSKNKNTVGHNHGKVTTLDLIKRYLDLKIKKMTTTKSSVINPNISPLESMPNIDINHLAIILDGEVQDILRTQNRMAALLLSSPEFVLFDPKKVTVKNGFKYVDGNFKDVSIEDVVDEKESN